jgi:hypothetical protein
MTSLLLSLSMSQSVDLNCVDIDGETVCYRAATEIDGEAVDVKGELDGPHISANWEPVHKGFNPMIELRTHFNTEIAQSVEQIR